MLPSLSLSLPPSLSLSLFLLVFSSGLSTLNSDAHERSSAIDLSAIVSGQSQSYGKLVATWWDLLLLQKTSGKNFCIQLHLEAHDATHTHTVRTVLEYQQHQDNLKISLRAEPWFNQCRSDCSMPSGLCTHVLTPEMVGKPSTMPQHTHTHTTAVKVPNPLKCPKTPNIHSDHESDSK